MGVEYVGEAPFVLFEQFKILGDKFEAGGGEDDFGGPLGADEVGAAGAGVELVEDHRGDFKLEYDSILGFGKAIVY